MRQGENLSPLLFAIFLNDFKYSIRRKYSGLNLLSDDVNVCLGGDNVEHFLKIYTLLYADDTFVLAESAEELQLALNAAHGYCSDWNLTVNAAVIKNDWKFEQYLTDLNFSQRVVLCKFRCHSNHLPISQSRFIDDILVDVDCLCSFCPGQIGDEIYYLLFCTFFFMK